jgi:hypothetical protein
MSLAFNIDLSGAFAALDKVAEHSKTLLKPAAAVTAQVFKNQAILNVNRIGKVTGNLASSIYMGFVESLSNSKNAVYRVSWDTRRAPHGMWFEYGYYRRYQTYKGKDGDWHTMKRPEAYGKRKPGRKAPQSVKDAYWVTLANPHRTEAYAFLRNAYDSRLDNAIATGKVFYETEMKKFIAALK